MNWLINLLSNLGPQGGNPQQQFVNAAQDVGMTPDQYMASALNNQDVIAQPQGEPVMVGPSNIQGQGVMAGTGFLPGAPVATLAIGPNRTEAGRYSNHADMPNADVATNGNQLLAIANQPIAPGQEVTVDYREAVPQRRALALARAEEAAQEPAPQTRAAPVPPAPAPGQALTAVPTTPAAPKKKVTAWDVAMTPLRAVGGAMNEFVSAATGADPNAYRIQEQIKQELAPLQIMDNVPAKMKLLQAVVQKYGSQTVADVARNLTPEDFAEQLTPYQSGQLKLAGMRQGWDMQSDLAKGNFPTGPGRAWAAQQAGRLGLPGQASPEDFAPLPTVAERETAKHNAATLQRQQEQDKIARAAAVEDLKVRKSQPGYLIGQEAQRYPEGSKERMEALKAGAGSTTVNMPPQNRLLPESAIGELNALDELKYYVTEASQNWNPKYTGPINQHLGALRQLAGIASPDEVQMRQALTSMIDLAYAKSGKQISEREMAMLTQRMPRLWNPGSTFQSRMQGFSDLLDEMKRIRLENYHEFGYYVPPDMIAKIKGTEATTETPTGATAPPAPAAPSQPEAPTIVNPATGQRMTLKDGQWQLIP